MLTFVASIEFLLGGRGFTNLYSVNVRQTSLWHLIFAFQPTLWLASLLSVFGASKRNGPVWPVARRERMAVVFCAAFIFALLFLPLLTRFLVNPPWLPANVDALTEVPHLLAKVFVFNCVGSGVGVMLSAGMMSVHVQLVGHPPRNPSSAEETATRSIEEEVLRHQRLRAQLQRCLGFAGGIISGSLLSTSAFSKMLTEAVPTQPDVFPATVAMGIGLYFTGLLAIIYLPAAKTLSEAGEVLAARLVPPAPGAHPGWKQWSDEQQAVRTWLGLERSALQELQQGLALLSPFIASLSTLLLGTAR